ncbi:synaptic vesicle glycoprotein 2B-like isoform X1 [Myzus persicae]|uniref:synaptic vesicle glycoprotein 2B-like isoform X1 n=2 Tax=Myzus persicae TaxID=13164 RepID=UPI000B9318CE|nr:synaptic vesicle glycoprotein 2B-like isoform X1 [Myzus persicae]
MEKDNSKEVIDCTSLLNHPVHLDKAIEMVGFGYFHYYLLFICGSLYTAIAFSVTSVSFIIPSAQCDFQMTSSHKGLLNGAMMIGMLMGSFIWGYVADTKGRRFTLIICMLMDGFFNILSSVSQVYSIFIFCRLLSGFGVSGATTLFSYLVEFLNIKYREKFLSWMEMFWTSGIILLPCVAWIIIPQTFRIENEYILFKSWNLFVIVCSLPSITLAFLLMKMPESPKFLLAQGKHKETINALKFVHRWNSNLNDKFPVTSIIVPRSNDKSNNGFFDGLYKSTIDLFTSKFKIIAIVTCIIHFCATTSYYMLILWFPELMNRLRWYETYSSIQNKTTMCEIVSMYIVEPEVKSVKCDDHIDHSVYMNIMIIGIACLPTSLVVPLFINKLGLRFFTVLSFFGSSISAAWLYFITSSMENIILSSIFEAFSSIGISLTYCITVELFPTEYRGMAASIGTMFGKIGALVGNILIGVFIDAHCIIPIIVSSLFLIISAFLVITLPRTGRTNIITEGVL